MKNTSPENIVVVGGGFAGLNLILRLMDNANYQITLIDKNNYNYFPPLVYQVATSFLDPSSICYPFRKLFRNKSVHFRMAELIKVDPITQTCYLSNGEIVYDKLVFATGAQSNFFGMENVKKNAVPMKTVDDALRMRNAVLKTMEKACITNDAIERRKLLTIVVAGGGPTGVELSGMLAELKKYVTEKDYPELKDVPGDIYIVDGGKNLLAAMSDKTHKHTYETLQKLGVKIRLETHVNDFIDNKVKLSTGEDIEAYTLIWAAGITAVPVDGIPATSIGAGKRMLTDPYNKVSGLENIYAIGDTALLKSDPAYPNGHPQIAQAAIQQGRTLAANFLAQAKGKPLKPFIYFDKGDMAIIGRNRAMVDLFKHKVHVTGFMGLFMWLFIHLISLVNYRNKIRTLLNWTGAYISKDQSLRMIFRSGS